ncbi:unnamed protein product, partial [Vitis vinifera]|uniref:Uncharacterized protein n=1 Tax=Vitis vinifera TaxID=29760 RepID=D7U8L4_VITVI
MVRLKSLLSITMKMASWFLFVCTLFSSLSSVMRPSPVNDLVALVPKRVSSSLLFLRSTQTKRSFSNTH